MACEYCNDGALILNGDYAQVWISDLSTLLVLEKESDSVEEVNIYYCPMCGRKLEGDGVATNTTPCVGTTTKQFADGLKKLADAANEMGDRLSALMERGA